MKKLILFYVLILVGNISSYSQFNEEVKATLGNKLQPFEASGPGSP